MCLFDTEEEETRASVGLALKPKLLHVFLNEADH